MLIWHNTDSITHHIVVDDGSLDSGNIPPGALSPAIRLASNGATYHCSIHPSMLGSINTPTPPPSNPPTGYC
jgi:plastocyanin